MGGRDRVGQQREDLEQFFHPASVAVIGRVDRSADPERLMAGLRDRYGCDRIHLVNPAGGRLGEVPIHRTVGEIPDEVTLAVISVAAPAVPDVLAQCGEKGVPYALVFSAGFSEVGPEGAALERQLVDVARKHRIRVFGPNTNTNAFERMPEVPNLRGGKIGLLTQSGHQGRPVVQGSLFGVGFSRWVPTGNEADLEVADFLEYFAYDEETAVIAGYFEGFRDPSRLRHALRAANASGKPVVALKIGATEAGSRMASSHTGHLTGSDAVVDGLFAQHGVTRVYDLDELLDTAALFAKLPSGAGTRLALYSISGGSGTLMAESAAAAGLPVPPLAEATQRELHALLPGYLTVSNPVDNGGTFLLTAAKPERMRVLELVASDPAVDIVVIGITGALAEMTDNFCADIREFADRSPKPVVVTWNSYKTDEQGFVDLVASGVPTFRSFRNCFAALRHYREYGRRAAGFRARPATARRRPELDLLTAGTLREEDARRLLAAYGVPVVPHQVVTDPAAATTAVAALAGPAALKVVSADFPHKSDAGLVALDVTADAAADTCARLLARAAEANPSAQVAGVSVAPMVTDGVEMIVGVSQDPVFGPALLVGTGGIFAEVLRDVAVRPLPVDREDVQEMVAGLSGYPLLTGVRGRPAADVDALVDCALAVAELAAAAGPRLAELDLNPVMVRPDGAVAVDALVIGAD